MAPHAALLVPGWHIPELSQQPMQEVRLHPPAEPDPPEPELLPVPPVPTEHAPVRHVAPVFVQFWHWEPPMPHAVSVEPGTHMPLKSQQPVWQVVGSQVALPLAAAPALLPALPLPVLPPVPLADPLSLPAPPPLPAPLGPPAPLPAPPPDPEEGNVPPSVSP